MLDERGTEYGKAWKTTGKLIMSVTAGLTFQNGEYFFPFVMILNKLLRASITPHNPDHWRDIIGYATLVLDDLEERQ